MKYFFIVIFFFQIGFSSKAQTLFSNAVGNPQNPAIVFMHGGPGYNAVSFELSAAAKLAEQGYYVITFDQRGCGRSKKDSVSEHYRFNISNDDINIVLQKYNVKQATFIGHSWGGTEALKFAEVYPEEVKAIILVSSPLNYQLVFKTIIQRCEEKFTQQKDTVALKQIATLKQMDTTKLDYSSTCFMYAMSNGFYKPKQANTERQTILEEMKKSKKAEYLSKMSTEPVYGFAMFEQYTTLDMRYYVKKVQQKNIPVYAIYGADDGLYNQQHLDMIKTAVGSANFLLIENASHNVFVDQRTAFITQVKKFLTPPEVSPKGKK